MLSERMTNNPGKTITGRKKLLCEMIAAIMVAGALPGAALADQNYDTTGNEIDGIVFDASGVLRVAFNNGADLTILNGATVTNTDGFIGYYGGVSGMVDITGSGTSWTNSGTLEVGHSGTGVLNIINGATVSNAIGSIGANANSSGTVTVDGAGSTWTNSNNLNVGYEGTGTLNITNSGSVNNTNGNIAYGSGSFGTVTVDGTGSIWTSSITLTVGNLGTGTLNITNGGAASSILSGYIGRQSGSTGTVTVDGTGSTWITGNLYVGHDGTGTLNITNGGAVNSTSGLIGRQSGSTGTVTVAGSNAIWGNSSNLFVGHSGTGTLDINNGGIVSNTYGYVGSESGSTGTVTVAGSGSTWTNSNNILVGNSGTGTLNITNGGAVSNVYGAIGDDASGVGSVTVGGVGSTWTNSQNVTIGNYGTGTLTIANGGTVSANSGSGTVTIASDSGATGTLNIGAAAGDTAVAIGTLNAATVSFGDGTGTLVFNHTDTDYSFDADISGTGDVEVYSGTTYLNGTVDAATTISMFGGTLGGSGTINHAFSVTSGSTLAPGNSVGTLNVTDVTFNAGSTLEIELNDGGFVAGTNNDLINDSGSTTINGGTVHVVAENGTDDGSTYTYGTYTILTAASGVTGTFDSVTDDYVFLGFGLSYDANNVYLTSRQPVEFIDVAQTYNQTSIANAVEALGSGNEVYDQLLTLVGTAEDARAAMDDLSGEIHASTRSAMIEESRVLRHAATRRMATRSELSPGLNVWGQAYGSRGNWDDDNNAADMDRSSGGVLIGADTALSKTAHLGVVAGVGRTSLDIDDRSSDADYDSYKLGIYGGNHWKGFEFNGGVAYSRHTVDTERDVAFSGYSDTHEADYDANTLQVFGEAGYDISMSNSAVLTTFVGVAHVKVKTDGYTESGGAAALNADSSSESVTYSKLGVRGERKIVMVDGTKMRFSGELGWQHALGDADSRITQNFAGGGDFTIKGVSPDRDTALVDLGAYVELSPSATLGVSYSGEFSGDVNNNVLKANLNVAF